MAKSCRLVLIFLLTLTACTRGNDGETSDDLSSEYQTLPFCRSVAKNGGGRPKANAINDRSLILLSTLDGKVSLLDSHTGRLLWSIMTGPGSMLSSSISKIQLTSQGQRSHLIPSLDGGLFKFNGKNVEALPVTAEKLLSSSFSLANDMVISGGKDSRVYGVDYQTGEMKYCCTMTGCKFYGDSLVNAENILLIRRHTQTVRAVDPRTGAEKWNYSVGLHEIVFVEGHPDMNCGSQQTEEQEDTIIEGGDILGERLPKEQLNVVVTREGTVLSTSPSDPDTIIWEYKFDSPVVDAWSLDMGKLTLMDLFDIHRVESSSQEIEKSSAALFIGFYERTPYIQKSHSMTEKVKFMAKEYESNNNAIMPQIQYKPYLVTADSRTPVIDGNHKSDDTMLIGGHNHAKKSKTALMILDNEYPYDGGYYLFLDETPVEKDFILPNTTHAEDDEPLNIIVISLWYWWREVAIITLTSTLGVGLLVRQYYQKKMKLKLADIAKQETISVPTEASTQETAPYQVHSRSGSDAATQGAEYISRYMTDFKPLLCLGRGGFGVVFKATNTIDDCDYAIKRICLPRDEAREKVMREVKALAKLDHVGIVRYYNAWLECPPPGWQQQIDKQWEDGELLTPTACFSSEYSMETTKPRLPSSCTNPLHPFDGEILDNELELFRPNDDSNSICFHRSKGDDNESGSFSFEKKTPFDVCGDFVRNVSNKRNSGSSVFADGDILRHSDHHLDDLRFHQYTSSKTGDCSNDSFIVFEDSGCGDKSNSEEQLVDEWSHSNSNLSQNRLLDRRSSETQSISHVQKLRNSFKGKERPKSLDLSHSRLVDPEVRHVPKMYLFIQMQLCQEKNLKDWLGMNTDAREKFQMLDIFHQIVSAVEYVHDQGLMHRDLKPSNIFFSMDDTIKVGDFGLVTTMVEDQPDEHTPCETGPYKMHTDKVGTQLYMSPEQMSGQSYSHKVDIFSLGLIFFELLVSFKTQMERLRVMLDVKQCKFPSYFTLEQPEECALVRKLLSCNPDERPSATEIKQHSLLQPFQPRPEVLNHRRSRHASRTISNSSSGSGSVD